MSVFCCEKLKSKIDKVFYKKYIFPFKLFTTIARKNNIIYGGSCRKSEHQDNIDHPVMFGNTLGKKELLDSCLIRKQAALRPAKVLFTVLKEVWEVH